MKKVLTAVIAATLSLTGCAKEEYNKKNLESYITEKIETNENTNTLYHYTTIEREEFEEYYKDQIEYINSSLDEAEDLDPEIIDFSTEYVNCCNSMLRASLSEYYELEKEMEALLKEYKGEVSEGDIEVYESDYEEVPIE